MIVDDQSFNIEALLLILRYSMGLNNIKKFCDRANDGQEALHLIQKNVEDNNYVKCDYHLIFMDCNMPFVDGYQAT